MSLWFRRTDGLNSDILREAASDAGVNWHYKTVQYKKEGIGFPDGDISDGDKIQDELQKRIGYAPVMIDEPTTDTSVK
jgi:hypothetical protein